MKYHPSNPNVYSSVQCDVTKFGTTSDDKWHCLTGMRRAGFLRIYFDGQFVHQERDTTGSLEFESGSTFFIGKADTSFRGALSNVRMWTSSLDDDQVAALSKGAPMAVVFDSSKRTDGVHVLKDGRVEAFGHQSLKPAIVSLSLAL